MKKNTTVLISGASIGGPALAYWLTRYGFQVTVVEKAPELRSGGQAIDFKGKAHLDLLERMGILDEVRRRRTKGEDQEFVDAKGRRIALYPNSFTGGDLEIQRGELALIMYERTKDACEYVFGDSITSLTETASGVHATFERGAPRTFDLVVGADGIHSNVRRLAFGPEADYVKHLGHYYGMAQIKETFAPMGQLYNEPGRLIAAGGNKAPAFFVFAAEALTYNRYDMEEQKEIIAGHYAGMGWRTSEIIAAIRRSDDVYLDSISKVTMDRYTKGRVALIGDAGYGNTLAGFGSGLAFVAGYVLAGELALAGGDHQAAFRRYDEIMLAHVKGTETSRAGRFLAPLTKRGIWLRNLLFRKQFLLNSMQKAGNKMAESVELADYPALMAAGRRA
ncbi:FAD-dependent monooxygenase [Nonomuraea sp. NPDC050556]|uniref:FAD-dependent monooxygenase n=1 Tax=Nonomuraea sp. NPDC050556 TaxID=3364369 RepID=UPI0037A0DF21